MKIPDILLAVQPVIQAFEKLFIPYYIGGSIASSVYGMARATLDVDIIADLKINHIAYLNQILEHQYYIDEDMIADAIRTSSSFNLIHLETMIKIDVFQFFLIRSPYLCVKFKLAHVFIEPVLALRAQRRAIRTLLYALGHPGCKYHTGGFTAIPTIGSGQ